MAQDPKRTETIIGPWPGGCNSFPSPDMLPRDVYAWGQNVVNRGGIIQTRPGQKMWKTMPGNVAQGAVIFKPTNSQPVMVIAIDGILYSASFPLFELREIEGYRMDALVEMIHMEVCIKSVVQNPDGSLALTQPSSVVMIQDGINKPLFWDGSKLIQMDPSAQQTPTGTWMKWVNARLWIAIGDQLVASDIGDPTTFSENTYIAERSNFLLPGPITGLLELADNGGLMAFTRTTTTTFKTYILTRTQWQLTQDFQKLLLPSVGCAAGRSVVNQYGSATWMSERGVVSLNAALYTLRDSALQTIDSQMMRSRRTMTSDPSQACACSFENFLLMSVPSGSKFNAHTWVMDQTPMEDLQQPSGIWTGIWTGTRPVQYMQGVIGSQYRCFYLALDKTGINGNRIHLWEAFRNTRTDNGGRIWCQVELPIVASQDVARFKYAELECVEIYGLVKLRVFVGGTKGPWYQIADTTLQAEIGCFGSSAMPRITIDSIIQNYKKQARTVSTLDFVSKGKDCTPEQAQSPGIDKGFQLLIEWEGQMGLREVKMVFDPDISFQKQGSCYETEACEHNIVNESGEVVA